MPHANTLKNLRKCLDECLDKLDCNDRILFGIDGSEWSIAHRLAVYLEPMFPGWNVDCEYNRQGEEEDEKRGTDGRLRRPDIIIHRRTLKSIEDNLLVIEMKKKNADHESVRACDLSSPPNNKRQFQYLFAVALSFDPTRKLTWFSNGQEI